MRDGAALGHGRRITVRDDNASWFELGEEWQGNLETLDVVLMRKDPPFDMEYIYTTYILELAEDRGLLVVNKPSSLRDINEKAYTAWFPQCTPAGLISRSRHDLKAFLEEQGKVVLKPLDGMGGKSIFVVERTDPNTNVILETLTEDGFPFRARAALHSGDFRRRQADSADRRRTGSVRAGEDSGPRRVPRQPGGGRPGEWAGN